MLHVNVVLKIKVEIPVLECFTYSLVKRKTHRSD